MKHGILYHMYQVMSIKAKFEVNHSGQTDSRHRAPKAVFLFTQTVLSTFPLSPLYLWSTESIMKVDPKSVLGFFLLKKMKNSK